MFGQVLNSPGKPRKEGAPFSPRNFITLRGPQRAPNFFNLHILDGIASSYSLLAPPQIYCAHVVS